MLPSTVEGVEAASAATTEAEGCAEGRAAAAALVMAADDSEVRIEAISLLMAVMSCAGRAVRAERGSGVGPR